MIVEEWKWSEGEIQMHSQPAWSMSEIGIYLLLQHNLPYPDWCLQLATYPSSTLFHKVGLTQKVKRKVFWHFGGSCLLYNEQFSAMSNFLLSSFFTFPTATAFDFQKHIHSYFAFFFNTVDGKIPHLFSIKNKILFFQCIWCFDKKC